MCSRHRGFESDLTQGLGTSESVCKGMFELLMTSYAPLRSGRTDFIMPDFVSDATVLTMGSMTWAEGAMVCLTPRPSSQHNSFNTYIITFAA